MPFNSQADKVAARLADEIKKQKASAIQSAPAQNPLRLLLKRASAPVVQKTHNLTPVNARPSFNQTQNYPDESSTQRFQKLPHAIKDRRSGKFMKRTRGNPFKPVMVLMPAAVIDRVWTLADDAGLPAATIWRRAVILGLDAAEDELASGVDLTNE